MKLKHIFIIFILTISSIAHSYSTDPILFLESIIKECRPKLTEKNNIFLDDKVTEYMDLNEMSMWIVGKNAWIKTKENYKNDFIHELKGIILKTYNKTVYNYVNSEISFSMPKNQNIDINKRIQISSIIKHNNMNININYKLIKNNNSWLIFDVVIEGISILKGLRSQFSDSIRIEGLTKTINKMKKINIS